MTGALWARSKGSPTGRWGTVFYFSAMELLQAATYLVIDRCGLPANQWLTRLSYAHIAFQPFFINLLAMSLIPADKARRLRPWVMAICALGSTAMLAKLYVPSPAWACDARVIPICGTNTCSYSGDWHIAWRLYLNEVDGSFLCYFIPAFLVPLFYGSWRWALYHFVVGPLAAFYMTSNKDEMPAIWCLTSIGFLMALHVKPIEHWMEAARRTESYTTSGPLLSASDFRSGFGGAAVMVLAYPLIRLSGGSEIFNLPMLCALFAVLAAGFLFFSFSRTANAARTPLAATRPELP